MAGSTRSQTRSRLSRERVLAAALDVADAQGLEAVTMRGVAAAVGVEAMSLYHHLSGKDGLLDGLIEAVAAEVQGRVARLESVDDWREQVRRRCLAARQVMLRHPWAPGLINSRNAIPPGLFGHFEDVLAIMIRGGFSYALGHKALHALGGMILGFSQELFTLDPREEAAEPMTEAQVAALAESLPNIAAMVAAEVHAAEDPTIGWCDSQTEFEFTLDLLLDGLERVRHAETR